MLFNLFFILKLLLKRKAYSLLTDLPNEKNLFISKGFSGPCPISHLYLLNIFSKKLYVENDISFQNFQF